MKFPKLKDLYKELIKKESIKDRILAGYEDEEPDKEDNVYKKPSQSNISPSGQFAQGF